MPMAWLVSSGAPPLTSSLSRAVSTSGRASSSECFSRSGTTVSLSGTMTARDGPVCRDAVAWTTTVTVVPAGTVALGSGVCLTTTNLLASDGASPLTWRRRRASVVTFCASESSRWRRSGTCTCTCMEGAGVYIRCAGDGFAVSARTGSPGPTSHETTQASQTIRARRGRPNRLIECPPPPAGTASGQGDLRRVKGLRSRNGPAIRGDSVGLQPVGHLLLPLGHGVEGGGGRAFHVAVEAPRLHAVTVDDQALPVGTRLEVLGKIEGEHAAAEAGDLVELRLEPIEELLDRLELDGRELSARARLALDDHELAGER